MSLLTDLDKRFLAAAAPRVGRVADRLQRRPTQGLDVRGLRALDERYASSGVLGFFREVPQLMGVVIGIVFVAGTLAVLNDTSTSSPREQTVLDSGAAAPSAGPVGPTSGILGPAVGDSVPVYLSDSARELAAVTQGDPKGQRFALVSLTGYYRPAQLAKVVAGYSLEEVSLRDPLAGKDASQFPVVLGKDAAAELRAAYAKTAVAQAQAQARYQKLADTTDADDPYKPFYTHYVVVSARQAADYGNGCACVFAAVVQATPAQLQALRNRPGVRAIQVSGKGLQLRDLDVTPLLPEAKGTVPSPTSIDPPS